MGRDAGQPRDDSFLLETADGNFWRLKVSPSTVHCSDDDDDEHEAVYLIGIQAAQQRLAVGGAYFSNSFGQPSAYVYFGQQSR